MKIERVFNYLVKIIAVIIFFWIVILLLFFSNTNYYGKKDFLIGNIVIVMISIIAFVATNYIIKSKSVNKNTKYKNIDYDIIVKKMFFIFLIVQFYLFYHAYFETSWDAGNIAYTARTINTTGKAVLLDYYSNCPNNILYTMLVTIMLKINSTIGVFSGDYDLMSVVILNSFISSISSLLTYKVGKKLFTKKIAFIGYLLSLVLFVLSPWNIVYYSDSFGILIPILILYIYLNNDISAYFKYPSIIVLGYIGYNIKPLTLIIVIAIIIIEIIKLVGKFNKNKLKKIALVLLCSIILVFIVNYSLNKIYLKNGFVLDNNAKFSMTHFMMMGQNLDSQGGWSGEDIQFSQSQPNTKVRSKENMRIIKERIKSLGPLGYFKFLSKKILSSYNDGTFAWTYEGGFFRDVKEPISKASAFIRSIYYNDINNRLYFYYITILQFIWINVIFVIFINCIINFKSKKVDYNYLIIIITIIGYTLFELLFEVRARYLYTGLPLYILMALYFFNNNYKNIKSKKKNNLYEN